MGKKSSFCRLLCTTTGQSSHFFLVIELSKSVPIYFAIAIFSIELRIAIVFPCLLNSFACALIKYLFFCLYINQAYFLFFSLHRTGSVFLKIRSDFTSVLPVLKRGTIINFNSTLRPVLSFVFLHTHTNFSSSLCLIITFFWILCFNHHCSLWTYGQFLNFFFDRYCCQQAYILLRGWLIFSIPTCLVLIFVILWVFASFSQLNIHHLVV